MIIDHDERNHIIVFTGNEFDLFDPPDPNQIADMISDGAWDLHPVASVTDVTYQADCWFVAYEPPEPGFEATP